MCVWGERCRRACRGTQHRVLSHESLAPHILGGKGVGAGGDGTAQVGTRGVCAVRECGSQYRRTPPRGWGAQLLCRDAGAQARVKEIVEGELHMGALLLTVERTV